MIYLAVEVKVDSQDVEKHLNQGEKYTRTSVDDMEVIYESTGRGAPIDEEWVSNHPRYILCQLAPHVICDFALPLCRRNPPDMTGRPVAARQSWLAGDKSAYLASFFCIILRGYFGTATVAKRVLLLGNVQPQNGSVFCREREP